MNSSFMQAKRIALCRSTGKDLFVERLAVIGETNYDWPRSYASVIRPADEYEAGYDRLFWSPSGRLLGLRSSTHCYFAYDPATDTFQGCEDIEDLSPFVLIGPETRMHRPDVEAVLERLKNPDAYETGIPRREKLEEALQHPNEAVREVARRMLEQIPSP